MDIETLKTELNRCIGCKPRPCEKACPLGVSPHDFIALAKTGDYREASKIIALKNPLPQTCGLVCPDAFCQKACIRGRIDKPIAIPCLQARMIQLGGFPELELPQKNGKKVAVIGGGPAGIGATYELIRNGFEVTIYEKSDKLGGVARLIPEYRLPKSVLDQEIARIVENERVTVKLNTEITDFSSLKAEFDNVILALGEPIEYKLNIPGDNKCISYKEILCNQNTLENMSECQCSTDGDLARPQENLKPNTEGVAEGGIKYDAGSEFATAVYEKGYMSECQCSTDGDLARPQENLKPNTEGVAEGGIKYDAGSEFATAVYEKGYIKEQIHNHDHALAHPHIAIVGGGEVALDCALSLKKQSPDAIIEMFVRRRREDMRIMKRDHIELDEHNIVIRDLTSIVEIKEENNKLQLTAIKNEINEEGKARAVKGTEFALNDYTTIITALGSYFPKDKDTAECLCAGDMTGSCGTVVQAIASGMKCARAIVEQEQQ